MRMVKSSSCLRILGLPARGEDLEAAEAREGRRHPTDHGPRLAPGMAVVEHVALDQFAGEHETQRPGGGDPEVEHRLAAQKLADRGSQHGQAVGRAGVRGRAGALELQDPALGALVDHLPQVDGAPVAQLTGPLAELVAAVAHRIRVHPGQQAVAGKHLGKVAGSAGFFRKIQQLRRFRRMGDQPRGRHRGRLDPRIARPQDLAPGVAGLRIAGQLAGEAVVEYHCTQRTGCCRSVIHGKTAFLACRDAQ